MKEIIITRNNSVYQTLVLLAPIGLFFAAKAAWQQYQLPVMAWGWLLLYVFLTALALYLIVFSFLKIRDSKSALRISRAGIEDHISMAKPGLIPWSNIAGSAIVKYTGSDHLIIYVKDAQSIVAPLSFLQQKMAQQMIEDVETPIVINPKLIRYDVAKLNQLINQKSPRRRSSKSKRSK